MCIKPYASDVTGASGSGGVVSTSTEKGMLVAAISPAELSTSGAMALSVDTIIGGESGLREHVARCGFGIYRAAKSRQLIDRCVDLLNRGGVVALVPVTATDAYFAAVTEQVEMFARPFTGPAEGGGILVLPTSGSTGIPKLVALPGAEMARFLTWGQDYFRFTRSTVSLSLSPWNFDVSLLDTWSVLAAGGAVVAADSAQLHDPGYLSGLVQDHPPTFVQVVPSTLAALVDCIGGQVIDSVCDVVLTGGLASLATRAAAARCFPNATFHNVYGATEVNDCLIESLSGEQFAETETLPLGSPIAGCEVVLGSVDGEHPIPEARASADGELCVRTPWMALGYIESGAIIPLPTTDSGLYRMKDRASLSDGRLTYRGRLDRTIKLRGQRVNLDEIEQAARHTGLIGMALAWVDDSRDDQELHIAYTPTVVDRAPATALALRLALSARLPPFSMPNHLHPFSSPFPLNGNGKPDAELIKSQTGGK